MERFTQITSSKDPRICEFCDIKERDLARNNGQFIAEGKVVLQHLINSRSVSNRFEIIKILILENRLAGITELLSALPPNIPIYVAQKAVLNSIAGFEMHRGILALGRYIPVPYKPFPNNENEHDLVLMGCGISNHDNLGSIFRNAAAFGVDRILLDKTCCHPLYRKAIRVSVGAALTVPFEIGVDINECLSDYKSQDYSIYALSPHGLTPLDEICPSQKTLLLLGSEGEGLPFDVMAQVETLKISQSNELDSLNVATASGIALWQISCQMRRL